MTVVDDILGALMGDAPVEERLLGRRSAAVVSTRMGVASVQAHLSPRRDLWPAGLARHSARELAQLIRSADPLQVSLGLAAVNALTEPDPARARPGKAYELILEHGAGGTVTVVGHFPFVERLRPRVRELFVLELRPREGDLPAAEAPVVIPRSDVVAITGTALLNHTLDGLLQLARGRFVIILGPSAPFAPVLFEHGVSALAGSVVVDRGPALADVAAGVPFRRMRGLQPLLWQRE
jgi:uncharacterized protein (DUF4213/DUF364 family)